MSTQWGATHSAISISSRGWKNYFPLLGSLNSIATIAVPTFWPIKTCFNSASRVKFTPQCLQESNLNYFTTLVHHIAIWHLNYSSVMREFGIWICTYSLLVGKCHTPHSSLTQSLLDIIGWCFQINRQHFSRGVTVQGEAQCTYSAPTVSMILTTWTWTEYRPLSPRSTVSKSVPTSLSKERSTDIPFLAVPFNPGPEFPGNTLLVMKMLKYLKGVLPPAKFKNATRHYFACI